MVGIAVVAVDDHTKGPNVALLTRVPARAMATPESKTTGLIVPIPLNMDQVLDGVGFNPDYSRGE